MLNKAPRALLLRIVLPVKITLGILRMFSSPILFSGVRPEANLGLNLIRKSLAPLTVAWSIGSIDWITL